MRRSCWPPARSIAASSCRSSKPRRRPLPGCDSRSYLRQVERSAAYRAESEHERHKVLSGITQRDFQEFLHAISEIPELDFIMRWVGDRADAQNAIRQLVSGPAAGHADLPGRPASRDRQFELLVAAAFRSQGLTVELAEPDVVMTLGGQRITVACKRPSAESSLRTPLRKARKQLAKVGGSGLVALRVDNVVLHEVDGVRLPSAGHALTHLDDLLDDFVRGAAPLLNRELAGSAAVGVMIVTGATAVYAEPLGLGHLHSFRFIPLGSPSDVGFAITSQLAGALAGVVI